MLPAASPHLSPRPAPTGVEGPSEVGLELALRSAVSGSLKPRLLSRVQGPLWEAPRPDWQLLQRPSQAPRMQGWLWQNSNILTKILPQVAANGVPTASPQRPEWGVGVGSWGEEKESLYPPPALVGVLAPPADWDDGGTALHPPPFSASLLTSQLFPSFCKGWREHISFNTTLEGGREQFRISFSRQ